MTAAADKEQAAQILAARDTMPAGAVQPANTLRTKLAALVVTSESTAAWAQLHECGSHLDPADPRAVADALHRIVAAPTQPLPPRGWLGADMAALDVARAVLRADDPVTQPATAESLAD